MIILAQLVFEYFIALLLAFIVHEGSHYIASVICGEAIKFEFQLGMLFNFIPIPRYIWYMPIKFNKLQRSIVAIAGFLMELLLASILFFVYRNLFTTAYLVVSILHICLYNFYAGKNSDFNFLK